MSSTPEAAVTAYFDALNRSDAEALTSLFDEYSSADTGAGAQ
jgi:hypothetical protein